MPTDPAALVADALSASHGHAIHEDGLGCQTCARRARAVLATLNDHYELVPRAPTTRHHVETFWQQTSLGVRYGWQCLSPGCEAETTGLLLLATAEALAEGHAARQATGKDNR